MVENEVKFVLNLESKFSTAGWDVIAIEQHYLPNDVRIRRSSLLQDSEFTINHKSLRDDGAYNELEYLISVHVFNLLKQQQSLAQVKKTRFSKMLGDELWAIDLLAHGPAWTTYFILAECEMPEGRVAPLHIPQQVSDNLLFAVPKSQTSLYSNYRLANVSYADFIYERIHNGS